MKKRNGLSNEDALVEQSLVSEAFESGADFSALERRITAADAEQAKRLKKAKKRSKKAQNSLIAFASEKQVLRQHKLKSSKHSKIGQNTETGTRNLERLFGEEITAAPVLPKQKKTQESLLDISFSGLNNKSAVRTYLLSFSIFFLLVGALLFTSFQIWGEQFFTPIPTKELGDKLSEAERQHEIELSAANTEHDETTTSRAEHEFPARSIKEYHQSTKRFPGPLVQISPTPSPSPTATPSPVPPTVPVFVPEESSSEIISEPSFEPTPEPTPSPSPTVTPTPAPEPSPTPVPEPSPTPVPEPSPTPVPEPSPTPVPEPSPTPAPEPSPTPVPEPTTETTITTAPETTVPATIETTAAVTDP